MEDKRGSLPLSSFQTFVSNYYKSQSCSWSYECFITAGATSNHGHATKVSMQVTNFVKVCLVNGNTVMKS